MFKKQPLLKKNLRAIFPEVRLPHFPRAFTEQASLAESASMEFPDGFGSSPSQAWPPQVEPPGAQGPSASSPALQTLAWHSGWYSNALLGRDPSSWHPGPPWHQASLLAICPVPPPQHPHPCCQAVEPGPSLLPWVVFLLPSPLKHLLWISSDSTRKIIVFRGEGSRGWGLGSWPGSHHGEL